MNEPRCETCQYFDDVNECGGYCRRHAPRLVHGTVFMNHVDGHLVSACVDGEDADIAVWPWVVLGDWCGEYARRPLPMVSNAVSGRATA